MKILLTHRKKNEPMKLIVTTSMENALSARSSRYFPPTKTAWESKEI
jgi:hypothetical protein